MWYIYGKSEIDKRADQLSRISTPDDVRMRCYDHILVPEGSGIEKRLCPSCKIFFSAFVLSLEEIRGFNAWVVFVVHCKKFLQYSSIGGIIYNATPIEVKGREVRTS